jgi:hypothetical protein
MEDGSRDKDGSCFFEDASDGSAKSQHSGSRDRSRTMLPQMSVESAFHLGQLSHQKVRANARKLGSRHEKGQYAGSADQQSSLHGRA